MSNELFLQLVSSPVEGIQSGTVEPLPYGLRAQDFLRVVEDIHEFVHQSNMWLSSKGLPPLEDLHEPAGFSGLLSRFGAVRLARLSHGLVLNEYHNGFPDLIPENKFPLNRVKRGDSGVEIKASRYESNWQSHSRRDGWFCVFQFRLDENKKQSFAKRKPTRINAVMITKITADDWNWYPAAEGKERSGTTQLKPAATLRFRRNAVWVHPEYQAKHQGLIERALYDELCTSAARDYTIPIAQLARDLAISPSRLRKLLVEHEAILEEFGFSFGRGKTPKRLYKPEAISVLADILARSSQG